MKNKTNIVLITKDKGTSDKIKAAFANKQDMVLTRIFTEVSELRSYLANATIKAVIVDIDIDHTRVLYELGLALNSYPDIYVVVVCSSFHKELVLRAMQAGARNFIEKDDIAKDLLSNLERYLLKHREKGRIGSVITILSAGGGCGATTVTVNLANELRLLTSQPVMTIDLDTSYGAVTQYLGINSQYGIADILNRKESIDSHLIQSSAYNFTKNLHVLVSPASQDSKKIDHLQFEKLNDALNTCRELYKYTVIDAPRITDKIMLSLADASDIVIIVHQLTVKDINIAKSYASLFANAGIEPHKIIALTNRLGKRGPMIKLNIGQKAIGLKTFYVIRNSWRRAVKSMVRGQPLANVAKNSGLRKEFKKLALMINAYQSKGTIKS